MVVAEQELGKGVMETCAQRLVSFTPKRNICVHSDHCQPQQTLLNVLISQAFSQIMLKHVSVGFLEIQKEL